MTLEADRYTVPVAEIIPVIRAAIGENKPVEMTVTGNSMQPLLKDRVSSVRLTRPDLLKKGDIVLFLRNDGHYALHRIINVRDDLFDILGDSQYVIDRNVSIDQIIAKVDAYSRDGRSWKEHDTLYRVMLPAIKTVRKYGNGLKRRIALLIRRKKTKT